ncbi:hypothetical protein MPSEU_001023300 [Mayamaea pseudoterrestris]|nr:hypothetical protein MPSEU_001023300 [Mayamaea pseudoterrestris]
MNRQRKRGTKSNVIHQSNAAAAAPPLQQLLRRQQSSSKTRRVQTASIPRTVVCLVLYVSLVVYGASVVGYSTASEAATAACSRTRTTDRLALVPSLVPQQHQQHLPIKRNIFHESKMWLKRVTDKKKIKETLAQVLPHSTLREADYVIEIDDESDQPARQQIGSSSVSNNHAVAVPEQPLNDAYAPESAILSYSSAFSQPRVIADADVKVVQDFSRRVLAMEPLPTLNDKDGKPAKNDNIMREQLASVPWGGTVEWFDSVKKNAGEPIDSILGGRLLFAYYRIMRSHMKDDSDLSKGVHFPFRLSQQQQSKGGLAAEQSIAHTLQWRRVYRPFAVTPSVIAENAQGFCYHRGLARVTSADAPGAHAMIWNRAGRHKANDPLAYFRIILNAADRAVAEGLTASDGRVGKFNVVVDARGCSWGSLPSISYIKQAVTMLQDHYPDRLGAVFLVNFSRTAEFCINIVKPLLTKEVREKLFILPHDPARLLHALESVVDRKHIPNWLGGDDDFRFDAQTYYPSSMLMTEEQGKQWLTAMPYHA